MYLFVHACIYLCIYLVILESFLLLHQQEHEHDKRNRKLLEKCLPVSSFIFQVKTQLKASKHLSLKTCFFAFHTGSGINVPKLM